MKGLNLKAIWALQFYCFTVLLLLGLAFGDGITEWWWPQPFTKNYVRIVNNLNGKTLDFQCKSGDDDLGRRSLAPNEEYEFGFRVNFSGSTLYFCNFWYSDYHAVFDAFKTDDDFVHDCGGAHCIWKAKEDGIYLFQIKFQKDDKRHDWEKIKS